MRHYGLIDVKSKYEDVVGSQRHTSHLLSTTRAAAAAEIFTPEDHSDKFHIGVHWRNYKILVFLDYKKLNSSKTWICI